MHIIGQFNLGFILATLGDDLFIIDQHASDEIYNFEKLQRNTTMTKQPLLKPVPLDLSAAEEQTVLRNMPVFLKNGFGFCDVAENVPGADINNSSVDPGSMCGAASSALKLNAVPFLKNVAFDKSDVQELVSLLDQGQHSLPSNSQLSIGLRSNPSAAEPERVLRPGKVRAALAMRACRSSIMIGTALDARTMRRVLRNLSTLSAPWNCPHGRPTMRHVRRLR
jgi:DNA mismatch repair protein PMS2